MLAPILDSNGHERDHYQQQRPTMGRGQGPDDLKPWIPPVMQQPLLCNVPEHANLEGKVRGLEVALKHSKERYEVRARESIDVRRQLEEREREISKIHAEADLVKQVAMLAISKGNALLSQIKSMSAKNQERHKESAQLRMHIEMLETRIRELSDHVNEVKRSAAENVTRANKQRDDRIEDMTERFE